MLSLDDTRLVCIGMKYCRRTRNPPSSCLCKKLIFWWERDDDWQPRLLGGLALGRWSLRVLTCPASCHQSCASPHLIINLWIDFNPTLDQSLFQVFYLNFHQSEASLVPPSSPLQLNLICTQTVDQPQRKLYFQPISILVPSFLSQYPPIRSRLRMSLLPDVSPGAKPLVQHPPTFLSFSQSLDSIISTAGTLVVVTSVIQLSTQSPSHPVQSFAQKPINLYLYISTYSHVICIGILAFLLQNIKNNKQCEYY